jgi:hypothetical protein
MRQKGSGRQNTLPDFRIDPLSLLTMPVKNEIPARVDTAWHPW